MRAKASHLDTTIKVLWGGVVRLVSFTRENLGIAPNMDFVEKTFLRIASKLIFEVKTFAVCGNPVCCTHYRGIRM